MTHVPPNVLRYEADIKVLLDQVLAVHRLAIPFALVAHENPAAFAACFRFAAEYG